MYKIEQRIIIYMNFILSLFAIISVHSSLTNLQVEPALTQINSVTTYTWQITFSTSTAVNSFQLFFPPNVTFSPSTILNDVTFSTQRTLQFTSSYSVKFNLSETSTSYNFEVTNVQNPPFAYTASNSEIGIKTDASVSLQTTAYTSISYTKGSILNCFVSFEGSTSQQNSIAYIDFEVSNAIQTGTVAFYFTYSNYNSSTETLTENGYPLCSMAVNQQNNYSAEVQATNSDRATIDNELICSFNSTNISDGDIIRLKLQGVLNPFTNQSYGTFAVTSSDSTYEYDESSSCTDMPLTLLTYSASFTSTATITTNYSEPFIESAQMIDIGVNVGNNDTFVMEYNSVNIHNCTSMKMFRGGVVTFSKSSEVSAESINFTATNTNTKSGILTLFMSGCLVQMAESGKSIPFTFTFFRNLLPYMEITASLRASAATMSNGSLFVAHEVILAQTEYTFSITTGYDLGQFPRILIQFPSSIDLSVFENNLDCQVLLESGVGEKSCSLFQNYTNLVEVNFTVSNVMTAGSQIKIVLSNIINPNDPFQFQFTLSTYYDQADQQTHVQEGTNIISQIFTYQTIYPQLANNSYTVAEHPSILTIYYTTQVTLPASSIFKFTFQNIQTSNLAFSSFYLNDSQKTVSASLTGNAYQLQYSQSIQLQTQIEVSFQFQAPSATGNYDCVDLQVSDSSSNVYEKTSSSLLLSVTQPASASFTISPNEDITGFVTTYTFSFSETVPHDTPFALEIEFPEDIDLLNGETKCSGNCNETVIDISSSGIDKVRAAIVNQSASSMFIIQLTSIKNPRQLGQSGSIKLITLSEDLSSEILEGTGTVTINTANDLDVSFSDTQFYYRQNDGPVKIQTNVTNKLENGDYFIISINKNAYTINSNSSISCYDFACTLSSQTSTEIHLKAVPSPAQIIITSLTIIIEGLISSSTTTYSDSFSNSISSYSKLDNLIDEGQFQYKISCGQADALSLNCKTCINSNGYICLSCYYEDGYYLYLTQCTQNCSSASSFQAYQNGENCDDCVSPCSTCKSVDQCLSCIDGYYLYENQTCLATCDTSQGFYEVASTQQCNKCKQPNCVYCLENDPYYCFTCSIGVSNFGKCQEQCPSNTYQFSSTCLACDESCENCTAGTNADCDACADNYLNLSGLCEPGCPDNTVQLSLTECGCEGNCEQCEGTSTTCLSCIDSSPYLYGTQCYVECPSSTYFIGRTCYNCSSGCLDCTKTTCLECENNTLLYENNCYTDCDLISIQFSNVKGKCIECQENCDQCDENYHCLICQQNYTLVDNVSCSLTCQVQNNCDDSPIPDTVLPVPGSLTSVIWLGIIIALKFTIVSKLYIPHGYVAIGSIIYYCLLLTLILSSNTFIVGRLLFYSNTQFIETSMILLLTCLGLGYLTNIIFAVIFCVQIRKFISKTQVDKIISYIVFVIAILTNFRFALIIVSKMFPNPKVYIEKPQDEKKLKYLCFAAVIFDLVGFSGAIIIIINAIALTDLFMIAVDLLIIIVLIIIGTIWGVFVPKSEDYYESLKKYELNENYNKATEDTLEAGMNDKNASLSKLQEKSLFQIQNEEQIYDKNQQIFDKNQQNNFDIKSLSLPNPQPILIRPKKKKQVTEKTQEVEKNDVFSKIKRRKVSDDQSFDPQQHNLNFFTESVDDENNQVFGLKKQQTLQKSKTHRSVMKKKPTHHLSFGIKKNELKSDEEIDEIDLQKIIKTKMVDKRLVNPHSQTQNFNKSKKKKNDDPLQEEISPSWFNYENQRYQVDDE